MRDILQGQAASHCAFSSVTIAKVSIIWDQTFYVLERIKWLILFMNEIQ